jgi:hypothetical protein
VSKYPCSVSRVFASIVQCLERHSTPVFTGWWVLGVCGCFVDRFVGGFGGGVTPGPFPNPVAKPTCADGTAPGRVWESRSPPALNVIRGGPVPHPGRHCVSVGVGAGPSSSFVCACSRGCRCPATSGGARLLSCAGAGVVGEVEQETRPPGGLGCRVLDFTDGAADAGCASAGWPGGASCEASGHR